MHLPWQARRFISLIIGLVLSLTYALWGVPFVGMLAGLSGLSPADAASPAPAWSMVTMTLGGLLASVPAAVAFVAWVLGDAAQGTGQGADIARMTPMSPERRRALMSMRLLGWLVVLGMLVGMMFSSTGLFGSWSEGMRSLTGVGLDLTVAQATAAAAQIQAFPFSAAGLFALSLLYSVLPVHFSRAAARGTWVPWRVLAWGVVMWLACVLVAVLPTYLDLTATN
ncbi:hypothetical protein AB0E44_05885 [Micrococcus terreus]|uniref:hypothetical protein n=1 Tax=Micrococcus terreus TaxID=574650 RepID=UPI0033C8E4F2